MRKIIVIIIALILSVGFVCYGEAQTLDDVLSNPNQSWTVHPANLSSVQFVNNENGTGYKFPCDYSQVDPRYPRCYWDAAFSPIDLSKMASIVMKLDVQNADSIQKISFYFHAKGSWYLGKEVFAISEGLNNIVFQIPDYTDNPTLLEQVDTVRFNVFNCDSSPSVVTIYNIHASIIKVEAGERPLFTPPPSPEVAGRTENFDEAGHLLESRLIFDEKCAFLLHTNKLLNDVKLAGFNVVMPVVWFGRDGAVFHSDDVQVEPQFSDYFTDVYDGLADFIEQAHAMSIEVHPCFRVAYHDQYRMLFPLFATAGTPDYAYDLQDLAYRNIIVNEIVEFVKKYNIDGINLDYVRTMGISFSDVATRSYQERYHKNIDELNTNMSDPAVRERFLAWQRDAVSDIVCRVSQGVRAAKPQIIISICGHPLKKPMLDVEGRNSWLWVENNWIDMVYAMCYSWVPNFNSFDAARNATSKPDHFAMMLSNYDIKDNKVVERNPQQVIRLTDYILRRCPERGIALYCYELLSQELIDALKSGPFVKPAIAYWGDKKGGRFAELSIPAGGCWEIRTGTPVIDNNEKYMGKTSIRFEKPDSDASTECTIRQLRYIPVKADKDYQLSAWVKGENITTGSTGWHRFSAIGRWYDKNMVCIDNIYPDIAFPEGTYDWQQCTIIRHAPANAAYFRFIAIGIIRTGTGTGWLDHLSFTENRTIINSSFEAGLGVDNGWEKTFGTPVIDNNEKYDGNVSVKFDKPDSDVATDCRIMQSQYIKVDADKDYRLSTWAKGEDITTGNVGWHRFCAIGRWYDKNMERIDNIYPDIDFPEGTYDWQQCTSIHHSPANAAYFRFIAIGIIQTGSGTGWIDHLNFAENKIINSSFEAGLGVDNGWGSTSATPVIDNNEKYDGNVSVRFDKPNSDVSTDCRIMQSQYIKVDADKDYQLSAWTKGEDIITGSAGWHRFCAIGRWYDKNMECIDNIYPDIDFPEGTYDWQECTSIRHSPVNAAYFRFIAIGIIQTGTGTGWIDGISFYSVP